MDTGEQSDSRHFDELAFCGTGSHRQLLLEQLACLGSRRNQSTAIGHLPKQSTDVSRLHNLQEIITCIVLEAIHLSCRVIKGETMLVGRVDERPSSRARDGTFGGRESLLWGVESWGECRGES